MTEPDVIEVPNPSNDILNTLQSGPVRVVPPIAAKSFWKHPAVILLASALTAAIFALVSVTVALVLTNGDKSNLQKELTCNRAPAVVVEQSTAEELVALGQNQSEISSSGATTLEGLAAIAAKDDAALLEILSNVPSQVAALNASSAMVDDAGTKLLAAIEAREAAIVTCSKS